MSVILSDDITLSMIKNGADGVGIKSIVEEYYLSDSNTSQTGSSWSKEQPAWGNGKYIWIRSEITWEDNKVTTTDPVLAKGLNGANENASSAVSKANKTSQDLTDLTNIINEKYEVLQEQIDGSISTWFYSYEPSSDKEPEKSWTTNEIKNQHLGDLFYIVDEQNKGGQCYRYAYINESYKWTLVQDTEITKALKDAAAAQAAADGKSTIYTGESEPENPEEGDLWLKSKNEGILTYVSGKWEEYNKYTAITEEAVATANSAVTTANGAAAAAAVANDKVNETVKEVVTEFHDSTSATYAPAQGSKEWSATAPEWQDGHYTWSRQVVYYVDRTIAPTHGNPVCITGGKGATGSQGPQGLQGPQGSPGQNGQNGAPGQNAIIYTLETNNPARRYAKTNKDNNGGTATEVTYIISPETLGVQFFQINGNEKQNYISDNITVKYCTRGSEYSPDSDSNYLTSATNGYSFNLNSFYTEVIVPALKGITKSNEVNIDTQGLISFYEGDNLLGSFEIKDAQPDEELKHLITAANIQTSIDNNSMVFDTNGLHLYNGAFNIYKASLNTTNGQPIHNGAESLFKYDSDTESLYIKTNNAQIGNWIVSGGNLQDSSNSIWLAPEGKPITVDTPVIGAEVNTNMVFKASSNFGVDRSGNLYASGARIGGHIDASSGTIGITTPLDIGDRGLTSDISLTDILEPSSALFFDNVADWYDFSNGAGAYANLEFLQQGILNVFYQLRQYLEPVITYLQAPQVFLQIKKENELFSSSSLSAFGVISQSNNSISKLDSTGLTFFKSNEDDELSLLGAFCCKDIDSPGFINSQGQVKKLLHEGNISSYAATLSGSNSFTGKNIFLNGNFEIKANHATDDSWINLSNSETNAYYAIGIRRPYTDYGLQLKYHPDTTNDELSRPPHSDVDPNTGDVYYDIYHKGNYYDIPAATANVAGLMSAADKDKLNKIADGANKYSLPTANSSTVGGVLLYKAAECTIFTSDDGAITPAAAKKAVQTFVPTLIKHGDNVTISINSNTNEVTINAKDTTYNMVSQSSNGLMYASDKTKLDNIKKMEKVAITLQSKENDYTTTQYGNESRYYSNLGLVVLEAGFNVKFTRATASSSYFTIGKINYKPSTPVALTVGYASSYDTRAFRAILTIYGEIQLSVPVAINNITMELHIGGTFINKTDET